MTLTAAADGSALGNPGPAGWAWYIDEERWAAGGWPSGTNNRGELQAVIELLEAAADVDDLHILCDSKYVINSITKWMPKWKLQGWKKANKEDVLNRDQMERLDALMTARKAADRGVRFEWVKGHSGHALNDAADERARGAAEAMRAGAQVPSGPGMGEPGIVPAIDSVPEADAIMDMDGTSVSGAVTDSTGASTVVVSCPLDVDLAEAIVSRARSVGRSPQELLADLIRTGWEARA